MKLVIIGTTANSILGFRCDFIKKLVSDGHKVYAFAIDYTEDRRQKVIELGAIPILYDLNRAGMNPISDIKNTIILSKKLKQINPNLVFSYFAKPVIFGTIAAKMAGVKSIYGMLEGLGYIFTEQPEGCSYEIKLLRSVQVLLYRLALPFLKKLIFLNHDDQKDLLEKHKIKIKGYEVLGGIGLNLDDYPYSTPANSGFSFLFIGRLLKEKGVNEFINAARIVKNRFPEVEFTVLGGLDEQNPGGLKNLELDELINSGLIIYPGHVNNVSEYISASSVFVLPSYREGFPRSTQEAMAIGRAVITTDVPGCRETVIDGVNGFIVPPWRWDILAEKMIYFIENPEQIKFMGMASHQIAKEKFDAAKVNKKLCRILDL